MKNIENTSMPSPLLQLLPLPKRSFLQRVFKQYPIFYPLIELNNLLAEKGIENISHADIKVLEDKYRINFSRSFQLNIQEYYVVHLNEFLRLDVNLKHDNEEALKHFKSLFKLNDKTVCNLHYLLGDVIIRRQYQDAVKDGRLEPAEKKKLEVLSKSLGLPEKLVMTVTSELNGKHINSFLQEIIKRKRFSPEDESELNNMAKSLGAELNFSYETSKALDKARRLWDLDNLELPVINTLELMQKKEECYFQCNKVLWYEFRTHKGSQYLKQIDTGSLLLTNKRLIFKGTGKTITILFSAINDFITDHNYLEIRKQSGRNPSLQMEELDEFAIVLSRLLRDA